MTRKDFKALAAILKENHVSEKLLLDIKIFCLKANPRFDSARFNAAVRG